MWNIVKQLKLLLGLRALQLPNGCYTAAKDGTESDMRFLFCAASVCYILNDWSGMNVEEAVNFILKSIVSNLLKHRNFETVLHFEIIIFVLNCIINEIIPVIRLWNCSRPRTRIPRRFLLLCDSLLGTHEPVAPFKRPPATRFEKMANKQAGRRLQRSSQQTCGHVLFLLGWRLFKNTGYVPVYKL